MRIKRNFPFLQEHDVQLSRLGMLAERYFAPDPNTCLLKLRQLTELLAPMLAARVGILSSTEETQYDLLRRLQASDRGAISISDDQRILISSRLYGEGNRRGASPKPDFLDWHRTQVFRAEARD
jgi:hypothetical protein